MTHFRLRFPDRSLYGRYYTRELAADAAEIHRSYGDDTTVVEVPGHYVGPMTYGSSGTVDGTDTRLTLRHESATLWLVGRKDANDASQVGFGEKNMNDPMTCIHQEKGLCPSCQEEFDGDETAWMEYGRHKQGEANWAALQAEMAAERAKIQPQARDEELPL